MGRTRFPDAGHGSSLRRTVREIRPCRVRCTGERRSSPAKKRVELDAEQADDSVDRQSHGHLEEPGRLWTNDSLAARRQKDGHPFQVITSPIPQKSYRMPHHHTRLFSPFCVSRILSPRTILPTIGLFPFDSIHGYNSHEKGTVKCAA
jgi:hypothetical protein